MNQLDVEDNQMSPQSLLDFRFDIDADPAPQEDTIITIPATLYNDSALQRLIVVTDDLRPLTCSPLEYSYRRIIEEPRTTGTSFWRPSSIRPDGAEGKGKKK